MNEAMGGGEVGDWVILERQQKAPSCGPYQAMAFSQSLTSPSLIKSWNSRHEAHGQQRTYQNEKGQSNPGKENHRALVRSSRGAKPTHLYPNPQPWKDKAN